MHTPRTSHLDAINKILRYLKSCPGKGIWMKNNRTNTVCGYSDADWDESFDRKSTTGFCTFVGGNLSHGKAKNKTLWHDQALEQNIEPWHPPQAS
jgi:hypothetical protein